MMSAFFSAVSGLKAMTYDLDVIANNISNVNTTGYKSDRVSFSDLLSQTLSSATGSSGTTGGTNAKQIGLGVSVASTDINMTVGSTESTGVATDASISGSGFYIVTGGSTGQYQFTREGDFTVDDSGNLTVDGYKVCGWEYYSTDSSGTSTYDTTRDVEALNLYSDSYNGNKKEMAAKASTENTLSGNIYADNTASGTAMTTIGTTPTTYDTSQTVKEYDSDGNSYDVTVSYKKCYSEGGYTTYYWTASAADSTADTVGGTNSGYICFDSSGNIVNGSATTATLSAFQSTTGNTNTYTSSEMSLANSLPAANYTVTCTGVSGSTATYTLSDGTNTYTASTTSSPGTVTFKDTAGNTLATLTESATGVAGDSFTFTATSNNYTFSDTASLTVTPTDAGMTAFNVSLDFSGITQTTSTDTSDTLTYSGDGYEAGTLESISIGSDGVITGTYSNGKTKPLAEIALATFTNPQGLEKIGDNLYATTNNSGEFTGGVTAGSAGTGSLSSGTLEMSNVDLANELSQMMIAERAYQANTKAISTADEMLQSLIAMKG
ncbi:MAG: flagellar hook-basal body complex protein [Negativicutes bacterium]|nr:flagellar hook-basal body complex protein [Negativicutes bacterium]